MQDEFGAELSSIMAYIKVLIDVCPLISITISVILVVRIQLFKLFLT